LNYRSKQVNQENKDRLSQGLIG